MPLAFLFLSADAKLYIKDTHIPLVMKIMDSISAPLRMSRHCLSHGKVEDKSCGIENNPWFHHYNSSDIRNNSQVYRITSKEAPSPALRAACMAHVLRFIRRGSLIAYSCPLFLKMHLVLLWTSVSKQTTFVSAQYLDSIGFTTWKTGRFWLFLVQR